VKQRVVVTLCDECGKERPTTIVRIGTAESLRRLDLCERCMVPARALLDLAEQTRPKRRSVTSMPLTSIEDVILRRSVRPRRPLWRQPARRSDDLKRRNPPPGYLSANPVFSNGNGQISTGGESRG